MKFECREAPSISAINKLVKSETIGKLIDNKKSFAIKKSVRKPETYTVLSSRLLRISGNL
jgi:hypothetical protein